jgi:hypothetical protein
MVEKNVVTRLMAEGIKTPGFLTKIKNNPQSAAGEIGINMDQSDVEAVKTILNKLDDATFKSVDDLNFVMKG